jgi:uncharacterized protein YgfB (UPF0149 family)
MRVTYEGLGKQLGDAGVDSSASEIHGLLYGLRCGGTKGLKSRFFTELFPAGGEVAPELRASLDQLLQDAQDSMQDGGKADFLLLPAEEQPLKLRAGAVRDWCRGFLYGLGLGGGDAERRFSGEAREGLRDLAEMTRMDVGGLETGTEDEAALVAITEYIGVVAALIRDELTSSKTS